MVTLDSRGGERTYSLMGVTKKSHANVKLQEGDIFVVSFTIYRMGTGLTSVIFPREK